MDFNPEDDITQELRTDCALERRQRSFELCCGLPDMLCIFSSGNAMLETSRRSCSGLRPALHPLPTACSLQATPNSNQLLSDQALFPQQNISFLGLSRNKALACLMPTGTRRLLHTQRHTTLQLLGVLLTCSEPCHHAVPITLD